MGVRDLSARIDGFQQRRAWVGFPLAVRRKYAEDRGGYIAAVVTYYAFFSLFPLLLVATTLLGLLVRGDAELQQKLADSVVGQFPLVGPDLRVHALTGSPTVLLLGLATALWAGMRVFVAAEDAADVLWSVPPQRLRGLLRRRTRALELLLLVGGGALATTALAGVGAAVAPQDGLTSDGILVLSVAADFGLFWSAFRLLAPASVRWRDLVAGSAVAAGGWALLQKVGGVYVAHVVTTASATYGTFAVVIGLLSYTYLSVTLALVATEVNVVAVQRLWPRSLSFLQQRPPTAGDDRAAALREHALAAGTSRADFPHRVGTLPDSAESASAPQSDLSTQDRRSSMNTLLQQAEQMVGTQFTKVRWALGLSGVLSIALGVVIIIWPGISLYSLVIVFGAYALARGVIGLGVAIGGGVKSGRGWLVLSSLAGIAVGVLVFLWTGMSALALLYVIGAYAIVLGIVAIGGAFWLPLSGGDSVLLALTGFLSVVFGIVMFAKPGAGALALLALIAAYALIIGLSEVTVAIGGERLLKRSVQRLSPRTEPQTSH